MRLSFASVAVLASIVAVQAKHVFKYEVDAYYNSKNVLADCEAPLPMLYDRDNDKVIRIIPANQLVPNQGQVSTNLNYIQSFSGQNLDNKETEFIGPIDSGISAAALIFDGVVAADVDVSSSNSTPPVEETSHSVSNASTTTGSGLPFDFLAPKVEEHHRHSSSSSNNTPCVATSRLVTSTFLQTALRSYPCLDKKCHYDSDKPIKKAISTQTGHTYLLHCSEIVILNPHCRSGKKWYPLETAFEAVDFILDEVNGIVIIGFQGLFIQVRCIKTLKLIYGGYLFGNIVDGLFTLTNSAQDNGRHLTWFNVLKVNEIVTVAFRLDEFSSSICSHCHSSSSSSSSSSDCGCATTDGPFKIISLLNLIKAEQTAESWICQPSNGNEVVVFNDYVNHVDIFVGKCSADKPCLHIYTAKINKKFHVISECQDVRLPCKIDGNLSTYSGARSDNNDLYVSFTPSLDIVKVHYHLD